MRTPAIRTHADPLLTLPVRSFWCQTIGTPRRGCRVDAITPAGAKLEGSHKLRVMPERVVVVESQAFLPSLELC
jgi:hypothetical protein